MKRFTLTLTLAFYASLLLPYASGNPLPKVTPIATYRSDFNTSDRILARAFRTGRSKFPIRCQGRVTRILQDDTNGRRHQRFILQLSTGQTLLIAHNIDLAPRIPKLKINDRIVIKGEYIWNELGGLIHYTHRDPDGEGFNGYIRHKRQLYR